MLMARASSKNVSSSWSPRLSGDARTIYRDIVAALTTDIEAGSLRPGDAMPSQRELAENLGINFTTVTRAYQEARNRGLLVARAGQGTFVRGQTLSDRKERLVDLASNWPPLVPTQSAIGETLRAIALERGAQAVEYKGGPLDPSCLEAGRRWVSPLFGYDVTDRLTLSAGARGAFLAVMSDTVGPGGIMLTEELTWPAIKAVSQILGIRLVGVGMDREGLIPDALDAACRRYKPKALYCTPTAQNPTGTTMSIKRRKAIGEVARGHGVTIIEDDAYGKLVLEAPPPIAALVPDVVVYVSGLAKTLASGLRVAYVVCPDADRAQQITERMRHAMLVPPPVETAIATRVIMSGAGDAILSEIKSEMRIRHDCMRSFFPGPELLVCRGALHSFLRLPPKWSRAEFIAQLSARGVRVASSDAFAVSPDKVPHALRLAIGAPPNIDELKLALRKIAELYVGEPSLTNVVV
jgi:DNA-binding transcriptional MocR family regulator